MPRSLRRPLAALLALAALPILTGASAPSPQPEVGRQLRCIQQCRASEEACFRSCGDCADACYGKTEFCTKCQAKKDQCRVPCIKSRVDCEATCT